MTAAAVPETIRAMAEAIRVAADPRQIILFDSHARTHARGEARADSDVDVLVVQERERWAKAARWEEEGRLRDAIPPIDASIDVLLFTPAEVDQWRRARNHVIARAIADGVVLYERG